MIVINFNIDLVLNKTDLIMLLYINCNSNFSIYRTAQNEFDKYMDDDRILGIRTIMTAFDNRLEFDVQIRKDIINILPIYTK